MFFTYLNLMPKGNKARVIILTGKETHHINTCATLISNDINVVGIFAIKKNKLRIQLRIVFSSIKKNGLMNTSSKIISRIVYLLRNLRLDYKLKSEIFNIGWANTILLSWQGTLFDVDDYNNPNTIQNIKELKPDIIIVHSKSWVPTSILEISSIKYVIGGHPGITPAYRGSHSPFWAITNNDFNNIGWTVFHLDSEVDSGQIIEQGTIEIGSPETFFSLSWKGMKEIAIAQVRAIKSYEANGKIIGSTNFNLKRNAIYSLPTLLDLIRYWIAQDKVR